MEQITSCSILITFRSIFIIFCIDIILATIIVYGFLTKPDVENQNTYLRQNAFFCNKTQYINDIIYIEKKIAFYDIRQHHINVDVRTDTVKDFCKVRGRCTQKLVFEYWKSINQLNSSIFDKKADELLIYTKDVYNSGYDKNGNGPFDVIRYRNDNIGYTVDSEFIKEMLLTDIVSFDRSNLKFLYQYELELMEVAYYFHNLFYKKLKVEYQKIEDKYNSIPANFTDYDSLLNEVRNNEKEMDVLEDFDSKRRILELREMKLKMMFKT
jgi:hypothetical protein